MRFRNRVVSPVGARRLIVVIGLSYFVFGAGRAVVRLAGEAPLGNVLIVTALIVVPGLVLAAGGYRLSRSDIHAQFYPTVAAWCLAGFGAMGSILLLYQLQPEGGISSPATSPPILTALSSVAGFAVGSNNARAKTRTRELEQTVAELERANDRLEQSNERLEQFAYAASHDLQEPLRMVSSYLQLIERRYEDQLDQEGQEYFAFAVDGADRMREMIEGLLAYSRVETQGDPFEPVDLEAVVDDVLEDLRLQIEETDATIVVDDLPRVEGDASQLRQVFQNLLANAIQYSGDEPPRIHVSADRDGSKWAVSVRDEGIGIDPDHRAQIFEVFERLHSTADHDGVGIGLALCQRIVERHGGEIRVNSDPGQGTTFTVLLPPAGREHPSDPSRTDPRRG